MNPYVTGQTVQMLREKRGITQKQLAEQLFISDKTVSKWETGKGLPDITLLETAGKGVACVGAGTDFRHRGDQPEPHRQHAENPVVCVSAVRECHLCRRRGGISLLRYRPAAAGAGRTGRIPYHFRGMHGRGIFRPHGTPHDQIPLSVVFRRRDFGTGDAGETLSRTGTGNSFAGKRTRLAVCLL